MPKKSRRTSVSNPEAARHFFFFYLYKTTTTNTLIKEIGVTSATTAMATDTEMKDKAYQGCRARWYSRGVVSHVGGGGVGG